MIPSPVRNFLLIYDRERGELLSHDDYGTDMAAAVQAYQDAEHQHMGNRRIDIVLVGSDSIDSIKVTHANYFSRGIGSLQDFLRAKVAAHHA